MDNGYQIGYYISMAVAIIGFMTAIFLFFFLDIRRVIRESSGKRRRKYIKAKEEQYSNPDESSELTPEAAGPQQDNVGEGNSRPENLSAGQNMMQDRIWEQNPAENVTSVLRQGTAENMTTVLHETGRQNPTMAPNRQFKVIQNIVVTHTTEKIQ